MDDSETWDHSTHYQENGPTSFDHHSLDGPYDLGTPVHQVTFGMEELRSAYQPNEDWLLDDEAMIDSGASASAGGEAAVRKLVTAVVSANPAAEVLVDSRDRPYFRFGDGRWGRALYSVTLGFDRGQWGKIKLYGLKSPGVPVLLGMKEITGLGFICNLATGAAIVAKCPRLLRINTKKHLIFSFTRDLPQQDEEPGDPRLYLESLALEGEELRKWYECFDREKIRMSNMSGGHTRKEIALSLERNDEQQARGMSGDIEARAAHARSSNLIQYTDLDANQGASKGPADGSGLRAREGPG